MKGGISIRTVAIIFALVFSASLFAQKEAAKSQLFIVHQDFVKPSMVAKYEEAAMGLKNNLTKYGMTNIKYATAMTNDMEYLYVSPIENYAELDERPFAELAKKMGEAEMQAMWKKFDGCYDEHKNTIVRLSDELSYNPKSENMLSEGANFRHWDYYWVIPGMDEQAQAIAREWKDLYTSNNIDMGYRLYIGDIGTEEPLYISVQWAKSPEDFAAASAKVQGILGDAAKKLNERTMALTRKFAQKDGWMRPDLSYMPTTETAAKK